MAKKERTIKSHPNEDQAILKKVEEAVKSVIDKNPYKTFDKNKIVWETINPKFHWLINEAINLIESGKMPGKNMTYFLQQMGIL